MLRIVNFLLIGYIISNMMKLGELNYLIYCCNQVVCMTDVRLNCGTFLLVL